MAIRREALAQHARRARPGSPRKRASWIALAAVSGMLAPLLVSASSAPGAVAAPVSTGIPAQVAAAADPLEAFYGQQLAWSRCEGGMSCAWLTVPLDYAQPAGESIRIRVSKSEATGPAEQRIGSLVVNPGGPGASGLQMPSYLSSLVSPEVRHSFDIIGFDPRGVGDSAPVTCMTGRQTTRWLQSDPAPLTLAGEQATMAQAQALADGCLRMSGALARHVGSEETVRDIDILRAALGDDRLNWLGFSYGTYIGSLYAQAFPERVGRFVLDGAVDPTLSVMQMSEGQNEGFQLALRRWARDCATRAACPYQGSGRAVVAGVNRLFTRLRTSTLPGIYSPVRLSDAVTAVFMALYSPDTWAWLRKALAQAERGNGKGLSTLADAASSRSGVNKYDDNMASAFPAISCWDAPAPPGRDGLSSAADAWAKASSSPVLARAMAWSNAPCSQWFGHSSRGAVPASSTTTAPIVIVGNTYDPATPYAWARALSRQLPTSTLLTYVGDGHTAFGAGSACVDSAVNSYLVSGVPPAAGTRCR